MSETKTIANSVKSLTAALYEDFNALRQGKASIKVVKESANVAGKILKAYQVRLENKKITGHKDDIEGIEK